MSYAARLRDEPNRLTTQGRSGSLRSPAMTEDGRHRRASESSPRRSGRGSIPNEGGLRKLGDQVESQQGPPADTATAGRNTGVDGDGGAAIANEARLAALGEAMHGAQKGRRGGRRPKKVRSRRRRILRRVALISLAVVLVVLGGGAGYAYYETHDLHRVQVQGLNSALTTGQEAGTENILMVGSTSRCALTVQNAAYGLCSQGVNGVNSDVIMILHADPAHHQLALLSIPRDLFIPNARSTGPNKIDAGLYQGLSQLVAAIEEDFGIPIQHAVSLNFDQFANIVDALGGINMSFPESVFDAESGLNVQAASCVHLEARRLSRWSGPAIFSTTRPGRRPPTPNTGPRRRRATWPASTATTSSSGCWPPR